MQNGEGPALAALNHAHQDIFRLGFVMGTFAGIMGGALDAGLDPLPWLRLN